MSSRDVARISSARVRVAGNHPSQRHHRHRLRYQFSRLYDHSFDSLPASPLAFSSCASNHVLIPATSLSISALLFPACTHTLTLSRPGGTVGYTIGLATMPCCCSHVAILRGCGVRSSNIGVVGSGGGSVISRLAGSVTRSRWTCEMLLWRADCSCGGA